MPTRVLLASRLREEEDPTAVAAGTLADRIGAELTVMYVAEELATVPQLQVAAGEDPDELRARMMERIEGEVGEYVERNLPGRAVRIRVVEGEVAEQAARVAGEEGADYLVVGAHGRGALSHLILGSTSQEILKRAPCPVVVVPAPSS